MKRAGGLACDVLALKRAEGKLDAKAAQAPCLADLLALRRAEMRMDRLGA